jgi:hypothetical protein
VSRRETVIRDDAGGESQRIFAYHGKLDFARPGVPRGRPPMGTARRCRPSTPYQAINCRCANIRRQQTARRILEHPEPRPAERACGPHSRFSEKRDWWSAAAAGGTFISRRRLNYRTHDSGGFVSTCPAQQREAVHQLISASTWVMDPLTAAPILPLYVAQFDASALDLGIVVARFGVGRLLANISLASSASISTPGKFSCSPSWASSSV